MTYQPEITLIKGDGSFPAPHTRRILPDKALLWKYYFKTLLVWLIFLGALFIFFFVFGGIISKQRLPVDILEIQFVLLIVFIIGTIIIGPIVLYLITKYIRGR